MDATIIHAALINAYPGTNGYIFYLFKNIDNNKLVLCTRYPNWEWPHPEFYKEGYLEYKEIKAGESTYYNYRLDANMKYKSDHTAFLKFIPKDETNYDYTL